MTKKIAIEQLYENGVCSGNDENGFILLKKAVEIVKAGGVDE